MGNSSDTLPYGSGHEPRGDLKVPKTEERPSVLVQRVGALGHLVLNRPRAINALTLETVETLDRALAGWETDPTSAAWCSPAPGSAACARAATS